MERRQSTRTPRLQAPANFTLRIVAVEQKNSRSCPGKLHRLSKGDMRLADPSGREDFSDASWCKKWEFDPIDFFVLGVDEVTSGLRCRPRQRGGAIGG
jgi:hypothetical protein